MKSRPEFEKQDSVIRRGKQSHSAGMNRTGILFRIVCVKAAENENYFGFLPDQNKMDIWTNFRTSCPEARTVSMTKRSRPLNETSGLFFIYSKVKNSRNLYQKQKR